MNKLYRLLFLIITFFGFIQISFPQEIKLGLPLGNNERITNFDLSNSKKYLTLSSVDNSVKVIEVKTGFIIHSFTDHTDHVLDVGFINNDEHILTVSADKTCNIYELKTGKIINKIKLNGTPKFSDISKDDKFLLVVAQENKTVEVFNLVSGLRMNSKSRLTNSRFYTAMFSPSGENFILGIDDQSDSDDNVVEMYNTFTGERLAVFREGLPMGYKPDVFAQDSEIFHFIKNDEAVFYDISAKTELNSIDLNGEWSYIGGISPNGRYIAISVNTYNNILIFDVFTRRLVSRIKDIDAFDKVKFGPNNKNLFTYDENGRVKVFDIINGERIKLFEDKIIRHNREKRFDFSADGANIIIAHNNSIKIYDSISLEVIYSFEGIEELKLSSTLSPKGNYIIDTYKNGDITVKSLIKGKTLYKILGDGVAIWSVRFSDDEKFFITNSTANNILYGTLSGKKLYHLDSHKFAGYETRFSSNAKYLVRECNYRTEIVDLNERKVIWSIDDYVILSDILDSYLKYEAWDYDKTNDNNRDRFDIYKKENDELVHSINTNINRVGRIFNLSNDGSILVITGDNSLEIYQFVKGSRKLIKKIDRQNISNITNGFDIDRLTISSDNKYVMLLMRNNLLSLYDIEKNKVLWKKHLIKKYGFGEYLNPFFSFDNSLIVLNEHTKPINLISTVSGENLNTLNDSSINATNINLSQDNKFLTLTSRDGSTIVYDILNGNELIRQYTLENEELWLLPNKYYAASKKVAPKLYYVKGVQTIGFEQLDVKYNRPDKVLEVLGDITGKRNEQLINAYKKAWEKRIRKLDIDTTSFREGFSVPESEFYNRDNITYEQSKSELKLRIKGFDNTYKLDRFNVWINEVPVYGRKGISLKSRNIKSLDTTITVELSQGENRIETSILNVNGIESYRQPLYVNYTPKKEIKAKLYFVGVGIDKYQEEGNDLNYSVKDIKDLSIKLKEKYGRQIQIDTLFNQNVTVSNIKKLKDRLKSSKVDDKVIISFSGHGLLSKDLDYYLATHNVNFGSPEENGLPYEDLEYLLDGIPSRQKLLLIDACHSGEVDKEEVESIHEVQKLKEGLKGSIGVRTKKPKMGMKNSFELMKELFNNVDRATGATVISAAAGTEFAQERGNLKNGVFTYCILNQLREKETISVSELKQLVSEQVKEITNGLQQPTSRNETIENDWRVW